MLIAYSFNDVAIAINRIPDILKNDGEIVQNTAIRTIKYTGKNTLISDNYSSSLDNGCYCPTEHYVREIGCL